MVIMFGNVPHPSFGRRIITNPKPEASYDQTMARKRRNAPDGDVIGDLPVDAILVLDGPKECKNGSSGARRGSRYRRRCEPNGAIHHAT